MKYPPEAIYGMEPGREPRFYRFEEAVGEVVAFRAADVLPALQRTEAAVHEGQFAVGFISYEAATSLDSSLPTQLPAGLPLLWFGLFRARRPFAQSKWFAQMSSSSYRLSGWKRSLSREEYLQSVANIRNYIASGDIYQANFTLRERFEFNGDVRLFFRDLCRSQSSPYAAFFELDRYCILSASPELFFQLNDGTLTVRPMKGTARRGRWTAEDSKLAEELHHNEKERAENLMIVDLLRNDLGMISENGSVTVNTLFDVESLRTVHQMTSTISSRLRKDVCLVDLFRALFPCGSITGAPKKRSMEIIKELESSPRGVYTGCIGYIAPGMHHATFSIAIRTVVIDKDSGTGELGVGSGITWYSKPDAEYDECLAKGLFAREIPPDFTLIESLLLEEGAGFFLIDRHLDRLSESACYFGFPFDGPSVRRTLEEISPSAKGRSKVRLVLSRDGSTAAEVEPLTADSGLVCPYVAFAGTSVDSTNPFLYHKTSMRGLYRCELEKHPNCIDVIFVNERGEVTEGANNNIVIRKGCILQTPPMTCGLLPGTFRAHLLNSGEIVEGVIMRSDVEQAEEIYLINSVRKWRRVRLVNGAVQ